MTHRLMLAFTLAVAAATTLWGGAARADINCSGMVGSLTYPATVTTIDGNVTVPNGASCTLYAVNVTGNVQTQPGGSLTMDYVSVNGNVQVQNGGTLLLSAYDEPSTIGGNVQADNCASAMLEGNVTVNGNVQIQGCTGAGPNGYRGPGIVINGNFHCQNNSGGCLAWLGAVGGDAQIQQNGAGTSDVSLNTVGGNLHCQNNTPAPTMMHGPNWVTGNAQDQCAKFSTTSTSIGTPVTPVASCAALALLPASGFPVPNTVIVSAVDTAKTATLPERCIVNGYVNRHVSPVDNCYYQDGFQVQLPLPGAWNGRFFMQGGGGSEGSVPTATGTDSGSAGSNFGIENGYAVASQDGGHENTASTIYPLMYTLASPSCDAGYGNANEYALDPMGLLAFAYQSIDVTALTAKYLIDRYYGTGPDHSYWVGCSTGGRQGMVMSQNFPQYFDGIVAGDPVYDQEALGLTETFGVEQILNVYNYDLGLSPPLVPPLVLEPQAAPEPSGPHLYPAFPASDQALIETALLQACDALDGVADGVIDNMQACKQVFNPATATYVSGGVTYPLQCPGAKNATCLSPAQIQAIKNINQGPHTTTGGLFTAPAGTTAPDNSDPIAQGYAYDGGSYATNGIPTRKIGSSAATSLPGDFSLGVGTLGYTFINLPFPENAMYYALTFDFSSYADVPLLKTSTPIVSKSTSLDLSKFIGYGHKIIWYHGASDPGPPILGTIVYYNGLANQNGGLQAIQSFSRLYPVPGMDHCTGNPATDQFDMLTPVVDWVENGTPPGPIPATGVNFNAATYQVSFVTGAPDNAPTARTRVLCPYPQQARFTGPTTLKNYGAGPNNVSVATNPADLASAANYTCVTPRSPYLNGN
jgi:hypothetical protein